MAKINKKKILIIGGTGFIGFHLLKEARKRNLSVYSISRHKPHPNRFVKGVKYFFVDINNFEKLKKKIKTNYDYVVNASGHKDNKNTAAEKIDIKKTHFFALINLVNIFLNRKIRKFIQIGSSAEYGIAPAPQKETFDFKPISTYGEAKLASTQLLQILYKTQLFPATILRPFQVYGPNQGVNKIIPEVIISCLKNKKIKLTEGKQIRDFYYVADFVRVVFRSLDSKKLEGEILNVAAGKPVEIKQIIKKIFDEIRAGKLLFSQLGYRKDENMKLYASIKKIKKYLKLNQTVNLKQGLRNTINYYRINTYE